MNNFCIFIINFYQETLINILTMQYIGKPYIDHYKYTALHLKVALANRCNESIVCIYNILYSIFYQWRFDSLYKGNISSCF